MPDAPVYPEFQSIVFYLVDFALLAVCIVSALRLALSAPYRAGFQATVTAILAHGGGQFWLLLLIWMSISALWAREPHLARYRTVQLAVSLFWAVTVAHHTRIAGAGGMLAALSIGAAGQGVLAAAQLLHGGPLGLGEIGEYMWEIPWGVYRGNGLTVHPNNLGGYVMVACFACVYWGWQRSRAGRPRRWPVVTGVVIVIGLAATMSRSAWLGLSVAGSWVGFEMLRTRWGVRRTVIVLMTVLLVAALAWLTFVWAAGAQFRISSQRDFHVEETWSVVQQTPLIGAGAGNLMTEIAHRHITDDYALPAHNVFMVALGELGVPGLVLWLACCAAALRRPRSSAVTVDVVIWRGCFLALCVVMLFDYYWWVDHRSQVVLFGVLGLVWGMTASTTRHAPDAQTP